MVLGTSLHGVIAPNRKPLISCEGFSFPSGILSLLTAPCTLQSLLADFFFFFWWCVWVVVFLFFFFSHDLLE